MYLPFKSEGTTGDKRFVEQNTHVIEQVSVGGEWEGGEDGEEGESG